MEGHALWNYLVIPISSTCSLEPGGSGLLQLLPGICAKDAQGGSESNSLQIKSCLDGMFHAAQMQIHPAALRGRKALAFNDALPQITFETITGK